MKSQTKNNLLVYGIPTLAALLVRIVLLTNWWDSPVRWYCRIGGLDMQTILKLGNFFYEGKCTFSLYNMFLALILFFNNGVHSVETIVIIQAVSGVLAVPLVAWCSLRIFGRKYLAAVSGLFAAFYAPSMMYESVVLKESLFLFFTLLSFAGVLKAHKSHFSPLSLFFCGIFLALTVTHRISALAFCGLASLWILACLFKKLKKDRKKLFISISFLSAGIGLVLIPFFIVSLKSFSSDSTYGSYLRNYIFSSRSSVESINVTTDVPEKKADNTENTKPHNKISKAFSLLKNMCKRIPLVFSASEIPNNINYYFLKYKLFPLQYLIGPFFLVPLAVTALILLVLNRGVLHKESILFVFILSSMLPLIVFVPLARYRLVLIPVFCMLAPYPFFSAWKAWRSGKLFSALVPALIFTIVIYINLPLHVFLRSTDFVSYGKGLQYKTGKSASAIPYFYEAYNMAPYKQMTIVNLAESLLANRQSEAALKILIPAHRKEPENLAYRYYLGIAYFFTRSPEKAEQIFKKINPGDMGDLKAKYYYFYESSLRMQKKYKAAAELRRKALKDGNGQQ